MSESSAFLTEILSTKEEEAVLEKGASFSLRLAAPLNVTPVSRR